MGAEQTLIASDCVQCGFETFTLDMTPDFSTRPPKTLLQDFKVVVSSDPPFRSSCRFKQSVYRENMGWKCGLGGKSQCEIGNYITPRLAAEGNKVVEEASISNMKQTWASDGEQIDWSGTKSEKMLLKSTQVKNIWVPYGV